MSKNAQFHLKMQQLERTLPAVVKRLPGVARVEGLKFIADNFKAQGFEKKKGQVSKWKNKKDGKKPNLIGEKRGGALRRSWKGTAKESAVEFTSNMPYAEVHNQGGRAGRGGGFTMPQRQMIGHSDALIGRIEVKLDKMVMDALKK